MQLWRYWLGASTAGVALAIMAGVAQAAAVQAPHRAVYDLTLSRAAQNSGVNGAEGRMVFEVTGSSCEGYAVTFRLVNRYSYREGATRLVDVQSTTFEAGDASRFDYQEKEVVDNAAGSEKRTVVERDGPEGEGDGEIKLPQPKSFKLASGTMFPMQHQLKVIEAAMAGQSRFAAEVFDGSEDVNTVQAIATIGARIAPGSGKDKDDPNAKPLQKLAAWPVSIAYFPSGQDAETPNFQITFQLYENGIASNLVLDYGNMALKGKLANLELLKADDCK
jgi:hypothetical protein